MKSITLILAVGLPTFVASVACPFAELHKAGLLSPDDAAKFEAVKRDPAAAEILFQAHQAHRREAAPEPAPQNGGLIGPIVDGVLDLPLGGGLLGGALQPLTGALAAIDIPTPQPQGLAVIPGNDPDHQFQAPGPTDVRGICPTLNALANHGYISRNGISSFAEAANAVQTGYGFTYGLSVFLSALGLLAGGDLVTGKYSIGGADSRVPNTIGPALGLDKHGVFEIDGSITREDVHFGNNANFLLQRWEEYVNISNQHGGQFNFDTQAQDNGLRYDYSRETNPEFLAGVAWFAVSHAERVFVYEGLANGTATGAGDAGFDNIGPFFLNETFPENWFRRGVPFTLPQAFGEAAAMFLANPRELGGNEGIGNFVPLNTNITSLTPQQLGCFLLENFLDLAPNQIQPTVVDNLDLFEGFVKGILAPFFIDDGYFNCNVTTFVEPSANAGVDQSGSQSSSGSPVDGAYPGVGVIAPDSQPS
ncbi:MAG: hypothetical protein M1820_008281 [Bogoriella megaspora]|nr:MAG: hypothetical protein M1820_008281 [Bogoriella megaspora]